MDAFKRWGGGVEAMRLYDVDSCTNADRGWPILQSHDAPDVFFFSRTDAIHHLAGQGRYRFYSVQTVESRRTLEGYHVFPLGKQGSVTWERGVGAREGSLQGSL